MDVLGSLRNGVTKLGIRPVAALAGITTDELRKLVCGSFSPALLTKLEVSLSAPLWRVLADKPGKPCRRVGPRHETTYPAMSNAAIKRHARRAEAYEAIAEPMAACIASAAAVHGYAGIQRFAEASGNSLAIATIRNITGHTAVLHSRAVNALSAVARAFLATGLGARSFSLATPLLGKLSALPTELLFELGETTKGRTKRLPESSKEHGWLKASCNVTSVERVAERADVHPLVVQALLRGEPAHYDAAWSVVKALAATRAGK